MFYKGAIICSIVFMVNDMSTHVIEGSLQRITLQMRQFLKYDKK